MEREIMSPSKEVGEDVVGIDNNVTTTFTKTKISVVPWYNAKQFIKVYEYLYSNELTKKRWAVDQISVWDTRCHPSLPTAVEASLIITRAIIQDILMSSGSSLCQERDIQMMYSMALVRFINLSVELHQTYNKQLIIQLAMKLGIPTWIVDLRNEATHSFTPSLSVLRMGAEAAMKYLDESFWSIQCSNLKNFEKELPCDEDEIKSLITRYEAVQYFCLGKNAESITQDMKELKLILNQLTSYLKKNRVQFLKAFVADGYFIPLEDDLKILLTTDEFKKLKQSVKEDKDKNYKNGDFECCIPSLPRTLEEVWFHMLRLLNNYDAISDLVEVLLYTQGDRTLIGQKLVIAWVVRILRFAVLDGAPNDGSSCLSRIFRRKGVVFNWNRLLYAAVANPCLYTFFIFPIIVANADIKESVVKSLMRLLSISQGQAVDENYEVCYKHLAFTLENLQKAKLIEESRTCYRKGKRAIPEDSIWSLAPDYMDFADIPIGEVLNAAEESENKEKIPEETAEVKDNKLKDKEEKFIISNENDGVLDIEMEEVVTESDTFEEDDKILKEMTSFVYVVKKKPPLEIP